MKKFMWKENAKADVMQIAALYNFNTNLNFYVGGSFL